MSKEAFTSKTAIIIGAGPAGLTAAYELLKKTDIKPIIIEKSSYMGGISKTVNYKGNRIDMGGHRFFTKSDKVMKWWHEVMPPGEMLTRNRISRVYFQRTFFDYPITISLKTVKGLGFFKTIRIGFSYLRWAFFPIKPEKSLEDFFINRFGKLFYTTFFKPYSEKLWGCPCKEVSAEWGTQRVKGVSITKALTHFFKQLFSTKSNNQKNTETSLIGEFLYPKYGPGQMWELVAEKVKKMGGEILTEHTAQTIFTKADIATGVEVIDNKTHEIKRIDGDYLFSTMPIKEFVEALDDKPPANIKKISNGLVYRDFIIIGLLLNKLKIKDPDGSRVKDTWIYIQEGIVHAGRIQIFNNWSPYMVADPEKIWIGVEYFCTEGDRFWNMSDDEIIELSKKELVKMGIIDREQVVDAIAIKQEKAYPCYFGTYDQFDTLKAYLSMYKNMVFIGRNGMHRYNNQDHAMLSAMQAVENIVANATNHENVWRVNTEKEYHESK